MEDMLKVCGGLEDRLTIPLTKEIRRLRSVGFMARKRHANENERVCDLSLVTLSHVLHDTWNVEEFGLKG